MDVKPSKVEGEERRSSECRWQVRVAEVRDETISTWFCPHKKVAACVVVQVRQKNDDKANQEFPNMVPFMSYILGACNGARIERSRK